MRRHAATVRRRMRTDSGTIFRGHVPEGRPGLVPARAVLEAVLLDSEHGRAMAPRSCDGGPPVTSRLRGGAVVSGLATERAHVLCRHLARRIAFKARVISNELSTVLYCGSRGGDDHCLRVDQ